MKRETFNYQTNCIYKVQFYFLIICYTIMYVALSADKTLNFDIALVRIKPAVGNDATGISFNDIVQPACLPTEDTAYSSDQECYISGWGKTEKGNTNKNHNLKLKVGHLL